MNVMFARRGFLNQVAWFHIKEFILDKSLMNVMFARKDFVEGRTWQDINDKIAVHQKERTFKCHICNKTFSHQKSLKLHTKKSHLTETSQRCSICNQEILHTQQQTQKNQGIDENHYRCDVCQELESSTTTGVRYICCICDVVFETANELENHVSVHGNVLKH